MLKKESTVLIHDVEVPVLVYYERRKSYRASFTKKGIAIRIPKLMLPIDKKRVEKKLLKWAEHTAINKPSILEKYRKEVYNNGTLWHLFDKTMVLQIKYKNRKKIGGKISGNQLVIELPNGMDQSIIEAKHISKVLADNYRPFFESRLDYWAQVFPVDYKQLRIKYNHSNWGSCSTRGNINLSTRLLLCPLPIIDYVMVHELAHIIHPNHSKQFWAEVARILPDWKDQAKWLKTEGAYLDF